MSVFFTKAINKIKNIEHFLYLKRKRKKLTNENPTIISNNCVGGIISHDLGQRFCSPTVNLFFVANEYIRFIKNLKYYLSLEVVEIESELPYPVGLLGDIHIYFMHYPSFEDAKQKWDERRKRVDYNNLYVMMAERVGCHEDIMKEFDSLDYTHKVLLVHRPFPEISCSYYMKGFEKEKELGAITDPKPTFWQRRYIDDYDYVSFLNQ